MTMRNWLPALCAAVLALGTGCSDECVDAFDCINDKGAPPEGQFYVCANNSCELHNEAEPEPTDAGTDGGDNTPVDAGTDGGTDGGNNTGTDGGTDGGVLACTPACTSPQECDTSTGTCVACATDAHCAGLDAAKPYCLADKSACVQCRDNAGCGLGQVCNASNTCEAQQGPVAADTSAQIAAVLAKPAGTIDPALPIDGAYVTYIKPAVGDDVAGVFLQAEATGPAVFVITDPATLKVGDRVNLTVAKLELLSKSTTATDGVKAASGVAGLTVISSGHPVQNLDKATPAGLAVEPAKVSDLVSQTDSYVSRVIRLAGATVSGAPSSSGAGHTQATIFAGDVSTGTALKIRMADSLANELGLADKCTFTLDVGPVWKFVGTSTTVQPSAYYREDISSITCPAPQLVAALPVSSTQVRVVFDRPLAAASVTNPQTQFTFTNGLQATAATVSGREVLVTTTAQTPDQEYSVSATNSVQDTLGVGVVTPNGITFSGYVPLAAQGGRLVISGSGFTGATEVTIGGTVQTFTVDSNTQVTIASVADATPVGSQPIVVKTPAGDVDGGAVTVISLRINELDSDQVGNDADEFVEIATGVPNLKLSGFVLVFFNGSNDQSYLAINLNATTNTEGLLVAGSSAAVNTTTGLSFPANTLQNGADAVAIYQSNAALFPNNTPVTSSGLIDALVYDTADEDDVGLLDTLLAPVSDPRRVQVDENTNTNAVNQSILRCGPERRDGRVYKVSTTRSPGAANTCT